MFVSNIKPMALRQTMIDRATAREELLLFLCIREQFQFLWKYIYLQFLGGSTNVSVSVGEDVKAVHIPEQRPSMDTASIIGLIIWFICVLYSSIRSSSNAQAARYVNKTQCPSSLPKQDA